MRTAFRVPAAFFGMVLGLVGLGGCWRVAHRIWGTPSAMSEGIMIAAVAVWALLVFLYAAKWIACRQEAISELIHPVQCCFVGLFPVSTMLIAFAVLPYNKFLATMLGGIGALGQLVFSVHRTGTLWTGGRDPLSTTPVLYLPSVAGNFVSANLASALGFGDLAALFFGAGLLAWIALESILMHRLYVHAPLAVPLRPTLGIQLAPAVVGCSAYLSMTHGAPDFVAKGLLGYGLLQGLILLRLLPWIMEQPFAASYWAFTFGLTAIAFDAMIFVERGAGGMFAYLAVVLFAIANAGVAAIAVGSIWLLVRGRILPAPLPAPAR